MSNENGLPTQEATLGPVATLEAPTESVQQQAEAIPATDRSITKDAAQVPVDGQMPPKVLEFLELRGIDKAKLDTLPEAKPNWEDARVLPQKGPAVTNFKDSNNKDGEGVLSATETRRERQPGELAYGEQNPAITAPPESTLTANGSGIGMASTESALPISENGAEVAQPKIVESPSTTENVEPTNFNTLSEEELVDRLTNIKGIKDKTAMYLVAQIVELRDMGVKFESAADLRANLLGLGMKKANLVAAEFGMPEIASENPVDEPKLEISDEEWLDVVSMNFAPQTEATEAKPVPSLKEKPRYRSLFDRIRSLPQSNRELFASRPTPERFKLENNLDREDALQRLKDGIAAAKQAGKFEQAGKLIRQKAELMKLLSLEEDGASDPTFKMDELQATLRELDITSITNDEDAARFGLVEKSVEAPQKSLVDVVKDKIANSSLSEGKKKWATKIALGLASVGLAFTLNASADTAARNFISTAAARPAATEGFLKTVGQPVASELVPNGPATEHSEPKTVIPDLPASTVDVAPPIEGIAPPPPAKFEEAPPIPGLGEQAPAMPTTDPELAQHLEEQQKNKKDVGLLGWLLGKKPEPTTRDKKEAAQQQHIDASEPVQPAAQPAETNPTEAPVSSDGASQTKGEVTAGLLAGAPVQEITAPPEESSANNATQEVTPSISGPIVVSTEAPTTQAENAPEVTTATLEQSLWEELKMIGQTKNYDVENNALINAPKNLWALTNKGYNLESGNGTPAFAQLKDLSGTLPAGAAGWTYSDNQYLEVMRIFVEQPANIDPKVIKIVNELSSGKMNVDSASFADVEPLVKHLLTIQ